MDCGFRKNKSVCWEINEFHEFITGSNIAKIRYSYVVTAATEPQASVKISSIPVYEIHITDSLATDGQMDEQSERRTDSGASVMDSIVTILI